MRKILIVLCGAILVVGMASVVNFHASEESAGGERRPSISQESSKEAAAAHEGLIMAGLILYENAINEIKSLIAQSERSDQKYKAPEQKVKISDFKRVIKELETGLDELGFKEEAK